MLKIIVGRVGEHLPFDFWRTNHWLVDVEQPLAHKTGDVICEHDLYHYFKNNVW